MAWQTVPAHAYGGLILDASADEVGLDGAIDGANFDLDVRGAVRTRDGFDNFTASAAAADYVDLAPFYTTTGTKQLVAVHGSTLEALDTTGAVVDDDAVGGGASTFSAARFGGPSAQVAYVAPTGAGNFFTARKWDGTAWASVAAVETGTHLAVSPIDNRLVVANLDTGASRVHFSEPGDPETFGADDFVDLTPGDGEEVSACVVWRTNIFVFKPSRVFAFWGTSVDSVGGAIFDYRPVDEQVGATPPRGAVAGRDGVYFINRRGIYVTRGDRARLVSAAIDPIFLGGASSFFMSDELNHAQISKCTLHWHDERLFFAYPSGAATTNDRLFVYDPRYDYWLLWNIPAGSMASFRIGDREELVFSYASGTNHIGRHSSSFATDDGAAIASSYRTGFYDLGANVEKRMRAVNLWGIGTVDYKVSSDFGSLGSATSAVLGTSPAIARRQFNKAKDGTMFSHQFSAASGAWAVHRCGLEVGGMRPPGTKTP